MHRLAMCSPPASVNISRRSSTSGIPAGSVVEQNFGKALRITRPQPPRRKDDADLLCAAHAPGSSSSDAVLGPMMQRHAGARLLREPPRGSRTTAPSAPIKRNLHRSADDCDPRQLAPDPFPSSVPLRAGATRAVPAVTARPDTVWLVVPSAGRAWQPFGW